jgi:hypothetical protein
MAFFDFLHDANREREVLGKVGKFLGGTGNKTARQQLTQQVNSTPASDPNYETLRRANATPIQTTSIPESARDQAVSAVRGTVRSGLNIGVSASELLGSGQDKLNISNPIAKKVLGKEPVESYQKRYTGLTKAGQEYGLGKFSAPLAFLGTGINAVGDVTPGSSGEKHIAKETLDKLVETTSTTTIKKILGDRVAPEVAHAIAKSKDSNIIRNLIKGGSDIPKEVPTNIPPVTKPVKSVAESAPAGPKPPTVIARSPTESPELSDLVKRGKLQKAGDTAPIDSLKLGSDVNDGYNTDQVKKYVNDIKNEHTLDPIVIDNKGFVQDGKHRLEAMRQLGVKDVPVVEQIPPPKLSGAAQQSKLSKPKPPASVFQDTTEISHINTILDNKETVADGKTKIGDYYRSAKGTDWSVQKMSPDEYLSRAARAMGQDPAEFSKFPMGNVDEYAKAMKNGDKFPMPWVNEVAGSQEGRTRALAAKKLGLKEIPVAVGGRVVKDAETASKGGIIDRLRPKPLGESGHIQIPGKAPAKLESSQIPVSSESSIADPSQAIVDALNGKPATKGEKAVKGITSARAEQNALLSKERGARFKAVESAGKDTAGSAGYFKELKQLKGEYSKVDFHPLVSDLGPVRAEELFTGARAKIKAISDETYHAMNLHPEAARLNTQRAVRKVLGLEPGLPTTSEIKLLRTLSPKIADEAQAATPIHHQLLDFAAKVFGTARSAKSTADLSMGGRQGLFVAARHPVEWAKANIESVKYAKSESFYNDEMRAIHNDEWGKLIDSHNRSVLTGGASDEEAFAGNDLLTSKALKKAVVGHVVAGSERAYTGGLTKLRKDILVKSLSRYGSSAEEVQKNLGDKGVEGLIEAVSTLTGRGGKKGGWVEKHATTLQEALFSPRLWASRLQPFNPAFWKRIGPAGRKEAVQSLGSFAAVASVVLGAAVASGAEVETDPRSSDFLKIKVGDTRYDILGGFQQNLVFAARELSGSTKSSQTGKITKYGEGFGAPTRLSAAFDLVRNKANPIVGSAANLLEGKDKAGNKINPLTEIGQLFVPISIQGSYQAIKRDGAKGLAKNIPDLAGIGTQTYGLRDINLSDKQKATVAKITDKNQQEAYTRFFQTTKGKTPSRDAATEQVKKALAAGDTEKAKSIARSYNDKYAASFEDWRKQYPQYKTDKTLVKEYNSNKITSETLKRYVATLKKGETL